jgi:hypothetical protein
MSNAAQGNGGKRRIDDRKARGRNEAADMTLQADAVSKYPTAARHEQNTKTGEIVATMMMMIMKG